MQGRRTQAERSAATQLALVGAARRLWGERGYADVSTPEIAEAAGVTRGAMYHQFPDKTALFASVLEAVETDVMQRLATEVAAARPKTPADTLHAAADAWLDIAGEPEVRRLVLLDAPTILGWAGFREVSLRYGLGLTEQLLTAAIEAGQLKAQPVRPLATVMIGALDEAAMSIANSAEATAEREQVRAVVHDLIDGLMTRPAAKTRPRRRGTATATRGD
ncbi:MAG TPA: helix-turn-helix domain-containing protein [Solirubrobacteraceae bacterium]|nr:helix-turn-helix domain-containing protein [Solirubrobacteraceae bacterium]